MIKCIVFLMILPCFAKAMGFPHEKIVLSELTDKLILKKPSPKPLISDFLACKKKKTSLPECSRLLNYLKTSKSLTKAHFFDIETFINNKCTKSLQKIYSLNRLKNLKIEVLSSFCQTKIKNRVLLIKYKSVDQQNNSI